MLINAKPRFAIEKFSQDEDGNVVYKLYDYATSRYLPVGGPLVTDEGTWDTDKIVELIKAGKSIESALLPTQMIAATEPPIIDKVEQADHDFAAELANVDLDAPFQHDTE